MRWDELPLARSSVDRAAHRRAEPALLAELLSRASTRVVLARGARVAVRATPSLDVSGPFWKDPIPGDNDSSQRDDRAVRGAPEPRDEPEGRVELDLREPNDPAVLALAPRAERVFLGAQDGVSYVAFVHPAEPRAALDPEPGTEPDLGVIPGSTWARLREVGHRLDERDAGLAATAVALGAWHASHRFCSRCGSATEPSFAGWQRRCTAEGTELYPRTDPAVIMAVTDGDDRILRVEVAPAD